MSFSFRFIIGVLFISGIMFFAGCEFQPHEIPLNNIEQPSETGPLIQVSLNDKIDTLKVGWNTIFSYKVTGSTNKIQAVVVTFEGTVIHNYVADGQQSLSFAFDPSQYEEGIHFLNIEIYLSTGTGSLADKMGGELYKYELAWPVIIDKALPARGKELVINAHKNDTGIVISWPVFDHPNFISYDIVRQYPAYQTNAEVIARITDPTINSFTDTTYWEGQDGLYYLEMETPAGRSDGDYIWIFDHPAGLKATWFDNGTAYFTWNKAKNLESFGKYYVYSAFTNDIIEEYFIEDASQNFVYLQNVGFGAGLSLYLKFIPKGVNPNSYRYLNYSMINLYSRPVLPQFRFSYNVPGHNYILLAGPSKIYRYFPDELRLDDSLSVDLKEYWLLAVSHLGELLAFYQDDKFQIRRTSDFVKVSEFAGPDIKSLNRTVQGCSLSDNGKLLAIDNVGFTYFFDIASGQLLQKDSLNVQGYDIKQAYLSPDGSKLIAQTGSSTTSFFTIDQNHWTEQGRNETAPCNVYFSTDGNILYIAGYSSVELRRPDDFSLISSFSTPSGFPHSADMDRGRIICCGTNYGENWIFDINSGQLLRKVLTGDQWCTLFDHYLVVPQNQLNMAQF